VAIVPVFSVGMGWIAGPELASAVSNTGACGVVSTSGMPVPEIRLRIQRTRALTNKPFGVNVILARSTVLPT
jgi:NAD(P)H-dependent flavin oxidoreductase YrpB (nitropropane dioxygenase family)